ncbi:MAG TPA: peptidoglycan-binding protein [Acidimicrobiales bacterium]|nr:peptidoglycan-binding protein [Acidimicrobiales bacterium]
MRYQALAVAGLVLAVLARSAPSDAATGPHQNATSPGPPGSHGTELVAGSELKAGSWLASPNGHYRLAMRADGNLVLYWEGHPLWASNTAKHPGAFLEMQADGDLVVYQGNRPIWSSGTDRGDTALYYLSLQDNGNVTIYSAARKAIWATNTAAGVARTELVAGTELKGGSWLASSNGDYRLAMQPDGNLVLYWDGRPMWASNTARHPGAVLAMQADGDLVVYQGNKPIWSSGTDRGGNALYYLSVPDNGNVTIYTPARKRVWVTNTTLVGLQLGDLGPAVKTLQMELSSLGYWVGTPDGTFGDSTQQAVFALQKAARLSADGVVGPKTVAALAAGVVPKPRSTAGYVVEVDLQDNLLMVVDGGKLLHTLNVSTGGGYTYVDQGVTSVATTPSGVFHIYNVIDGLDVDSLGALWRPRFFVGGFAVHGDSYVPPFPVSHGCVRVSDEAINWIWGANVMPIGTEVWVY